MNALVFEKVGASLAAETSIGLTQDMVRIDSTNGKEDTLARDLEAKLKSLGIGRVWCEKTFEGRLNTLWEVDSGKSGPHLLFTGHLDTKPVCEGWQRDPFDGAIGPIAGTVASLGHNLIGDGTGMSGISNGSNGNQVGSSGSPIHPLLAALMNNGGPTFTHGLLYNSPAVDAGNDCVFTNTCSPSLGSALNTDQRGLSRKADGDLVSGAHVDIGAYERQATESRPVPLGANVHIDLNDVRLAFPTVSGSRPEDGAANTLAPAVAGRSVSITVIPVPGDAPPTSFAAFDVMPSSAFYTAPVDVCFYLPSITPKATFDNLKVFHRESGVLTDHGTYVNFASRIACTEVTSPMKCTSPSASRTTRGRRLRQACAAAATQRARSATETPGPSATMRACA